MLQLAQTEPLTRRRIDAYVRYIVELIDRVIVEVGLRSRRINDGHTSTVLQVVQTQQLQLVEVDLERLVVRTALGLNTRHQDEVKRLVGELLDETCKRHDREIETLTLGITVHVKEHLVARLEIEVLTNARTLTVRQRLEHQRINTVLQNINLNVGCRQAGHEVLLPLLREAEDTVRGILNVTEQTHIRTLVHLVKVDPELPRLRDILYLLDELIDHDGVVINHDDVGIHGIHILLELVKAKPLLLRVLVGCSIVLDNAR